MIVLLTSDRGLAGAFNANIIKAARAKAQALSAEGKTVTFYVAGRKGMNVIKRYHGQQLTKYYDTTATKQAGLEQAREIAVELTQMAEAGTFDIAHMFYSKFRSALVQTPTEQQIIPVKIDLAPDAGPDAATEYEPEEAEILAQLLPRNLTTQLFGAFLENNASEQGASMTAMDNATRNAGDLINKLTIEYNRSRQAAITTELVEIISGAEAL
jgi:F-type H+-transporting ATPase subunit gamma